jgi:hypothetical protein
MMCLKLGDVCRKTVQTPSFMLTDNINHMVTANPQGKSMQKLLTCAALLFALAAQSSAWASSKLLLETTFETGQIQKSSSSVDGVYVQTLPDPQTGDEFIATGSGGFGPDTNWDARVVSQETVGGQVVKPRQGNYFLRSVIDKNKNYLALNNYTRDKPRNGFRMTTVSQRLEFDEEGWVGFSIFLPSNWEHEQGVNDHRGGTSLFVINATPSASFVSMTQYVPKGQTKAHWHVRLHLSDTTATESGGSYSTEWINIGSVEPDLGKWTDFVFRVRANPFTKTTNPAELGIPNSKDQTYEGNRGILQIWKSEGANRDMALKVSKVNTPVGLVPHATNLLEVRLQLYKYGWRENPTTVNGPIWVGFDEIRFGSTVRNGTGFADVDPSGGSQSSASPRPPAPIVVD